jgi:hypothetical protein
LFLIEFLLGRIIGSYLERFQNGFRTISERFQSVFTGIMISINESYLKRFQSVFRAFSKRFQSVFAGIMIGSKEFGNQIPTKKGQACLATESVAELSFRSLQSPLGLCRGRNLFEC